MPGKHSKPTYCSCMALVPYLMLFLILALEVGGLTRFYYSQADHWKYSIECYLATFFYASTFFIIFKSLWKTKNMDPGYKIPHSVEHKKYSVEDKEVE